VNVVNVLAWLPGRDTSRVLVMGGHYDSCICSVRPNGSNDSVATAPGADDDGSGTSAVIELARVFAKRFPKGLENTVIFALYASEEQGTNGSRQLAERLRDGGYKVIGGMTDDIVGNVVADDGSVDSTTMRIFAADPDTSKSRELGRYVWGLSKIYSPNFEVRPIFRLDRLGRGGDHGPFVRLDYAGLRFTESLENYKRQHLPTDDFAHVNFGYVANVARINAMTVATLGLAPARPDSAKPARDNTESGGQAWNVSWTAVPGAAGYEILVRRTTAPTWEEVIPVGNVTQFLLKRQLDDLWAAVRTVGANGHRSLATYIVSPPRPPAAAPARPPMQ
jgi:Zn-dependent M28 family amino/carboxypeptidase